MMRTSAWAALLALGTAVALGCATNPRPVATEHVDGIAAGERPSAAGTGSSLVVLGRLLFHDNRLSRSRDVACGSCHKLSKFGVDGKPAGMAVVAPGAASNGQRVFNTRTHLAEMWDARASNIQSQVIDVDVAGALGRVPRYVELFDSAFPQGRRPIGIDSVSDAIETFERGLVSNSRWDKFSDGDVSALSLEEKHGLRVFLESGCVACHSGPQVGGTMYRQVGIAYPWPKQKGAKTGEVDSVTARLSLRVPSLKNIAESAPYFHDSSVSNLEAAIRLMGHHQLGVELSSDDINAIAAWMRALSGDVDPAYIAVPELPPEG